MKLNTLDIKNTLLLYVDFCELIYFEQHPLFYTDTTSAHLLPLLSELTLMSFLVRSLYEDVPVTVSVCIHW
jgi:hypothetical protein